MCGIVGYVGKKPAAPILYERLKLLEYRGYDSAGICTVNGGKYHVAKRSGRVGELSGMLNGLEGSVGIAHTRWATHGKPTENNAHPHVKGRFALVHNGIIENEKQLREELLKKGANFCSETDSELIAHLLDEAYHGDPLIALYAVCQKLIGSYALAVLCSDFPDTIYAVRHASPLIIGIKQGEFFLASDIPAVDETGIKIFPLEENEYAQISSVGVMFFNKDLREISKKCVKYTAQDNKSVKGKYAHFMRKEMDEIPLAIIHTIENIPKNDRYNEVCEVLCQTEYIKIVACGTAYHSGIAAKYVIEENLRIPVEVCIASEFRYSNPIICPRTLVLAISQSGETADTLAAASLAEERGATVVAITNVRHSSITRIADYSIYTQAGQEVAVAATKSYIAQLVSLYYMIDFLAKSTGVMLDLKLDSLANDCRATLRLCDHIKEWATTIAKAKSVYFLGRGIDYAAAVEGSLKLKEISYIPSEGYAAGELKHGTLALIDEDTPVVVILTQKRLANKTLNAIHEVAARGAKIFFITNMEDYTSDKGIYSSICIPVSCEETSPMSSVIVLQALAYFTALERGNDPDKPRNLAKSVTVE